MSKKNVLNYKIITVIVYDLGGGGNEWNNFTE